VSTANEAAAELKIAQRPTSGSEHGAEPPAESWLHPHHHLGHPHLPLPHPHPDHHPHQGHPHRLHKLSEAAAVNEIHH
jgi:hypothetical protein